MAADLGITARASSPRGFDGLGDDDCDRTLIAEIAAGDEAALIAMHGRYHQRIKRFARRLTNREDLVEEITNDTLQVIWQHAARFKGTSKVSTWIFGVVYRISMKTLRTMGRRWPTANPMDDTLEAAHEPGVQAEVDEWIGAALARLPDEQRTVVELSYVLGHSCQEIARQVKCPINTVKTRLYHGRRKLRQLLPRLAGESAI